MLNFNFNKNFSVQGQSLIEVIIAVGIFSVGIATVALFIFDGFSGASSYLNRSKGVFLAREGLEAVRSIRDNDFENLTPGTHGLEIVDGKWSLAGSSDIKDKYKRWVKVEEAAADTKKITSHVEWSTDRTGKQEINLNSYLTNWGKLTSDLQPIAHWEMNSASGTVAYDSADGHDGQIDGASWRAGVEGNGLGFDGQNDLVDIPNNFGIFDGTEDFTLSAWFKVNSFLSPADWGGTSIINLTGERGVLLTLGDAVSPDELAVRVKTGAWTWKTMATKDSLETGSWYHAVVVYDQESWELYLNGTSVAATTSGATPIASTTKDSELGHDTADWSEQYFDGAMDQVSIYDQALTSKQVSDLYGKYEPMLSPYAYWKLNQDSTTTAYDYVGSNDGDITGAHRVLGIDGNGLQFDGTDDYVEVSDNNGFRETNNFSVSLWVNAADVSGIKYIIDKWWYENSNSRSWSLDFSGGSLVWRGSPDGSDSAQKEISYNYADHIYKWTHVVGTHDGDHLNLYINGQLVGTTSLSGCTYTEKPVMIGAGNQGSSFNFEGALDDIRYYRGTLSAAEVEAIYNTTKPDQSLPEGQLAYWKMDEGSGNMAYDSINENDGSISGATWEKGVSDDCLSFDGDNDKVEVNRINSLNIQSDQLTVEAWVKWNKNPSSGKKWANILNKPSANWAPSYRLQHSQDNSNFEFVLSTENSSNAFIQSTSIPQEGQWYYVVGTYDGSEMKLYVNGSLQKSKSVTGNLVSAYTPFYIGTKGTARFFNGAIDEVSVHKDVLTAGEISTRYTNLKPNAPYPPAVNTTNIGENTAQLNATVTDPDGNAIDWVEFYDDTNNNLIARATTTKDSPANYEFTWDGLSSNTNYYWYAKAKDVTGLVSDKSDVASFTTDSNISSCQDYCGTQGYDNGGCLGSSACSLWGGTVESGGDRYCSSWWWPTCCCWNW